MVLESVRQTYVNHYKKSVLSQRWSGDVPCNKKAEHSVEAPINFVLCTISQRFYLLHLCWYVISQYCFYWFGCFSYEVCMPCLISLDFCLALTSADSMQH